MRTRRWAWRCNVGMRRTATCIWIVGVLVCLFDIPWLANAFAPTLSHHPVQGGRRTRHTCIFSPRCCQDKIVVAATGIDRACRAKRGGNDDADYAGGCGVDSVYYNDDAFGLVFLSASLVIKDFSFAGAFLLLSAIAASASNANIANTVKFLPVIPGIVAFAALAISKVEPFAETAQSLGGDFVVPIDEQGSQLELILCSISLIWGMIQQVRSDGDKAASDALE